MLPYLSTAGVPKSLKGNVHPFNYNEFDHLTELVNQNEIGVIKMEVIRNIQPRDNFLQRVRKLANDNGIVLIFDECTSGFREPVLEVYIKKSMRSTRYCSLWQDPRKWICNLQNIVGREEIMQCPSNQHL